MKKVTQSDSRYARAGGALMRFGPDLVRFAYSYLLNLADAQDAVQDALVAYMKRAPEFGDDESEKAWLFTVTANKCRSFLRSGWFKSRAEIPESVPAQDESREVLNALSRLPRKYRMPLHLHYFEGYSIEEIAAMLNAKPATVGTWLARGREMLKTEIGGFDDEEQ
ncbi:MAG: RNA polymerase sigma factor [Clostridia bacterium]|nr:RNA polymerase sigma factor [Clostridia bacterium]